MAPGQTSGFINYPNYDLVDAAGGTINFGDTAQDGTGDDGTDEISILGNDGYEDDTNNGSEEVKGVRHNRSQTPYFQFFGIVPGKTALNKVVGRFFADKIDAVTLLGAGASPDDVSQSSVNKPNVNNEEDNPFTVFRTCLGDTLIQKVKVIDPNGTVSTGGNSGGNTSSNTGGNSSSNTSSNTGGPTGAPPPGGPTTNIVTNINGGIPSTINCQTPQSNSTSSIEINSTTTPITLTLNGGTNQNSVEWRIILYDTPVTQSSILSSSDVTMSDSSGQIYEINTSYPNQSGGSTIVDILFSNLGNYQAYIYYTSGCANSNYNGGITISA